MSCCVSHDSTLFPPPLSSSLPLGHPPTCRSPIANLNSWRQLAAYACQTASGCQRQCCPSPKGHLYVTVPHYPTTLPCPTVLTLFPPLSLSLRLHAIFMTDNKTCEHDELPLPLPVPVPVLLHRIVVAWSSTCCLPHTVSNSSSRIADSTRQTGLNWTDRGGTDGQWVDMLALHFHAQINLTAAVFRWALFAMFAMLQVSLLLPSSYALPSTANCLGILAVWRALAAFLIKFSIIVIWT